MSRVRPAVRGAVLGTLPAHTVTLAAAGLLLLGAACTDPGSERSLSNADAGPADSRLADPADPRPAPRSDSPALVGGTGAPDPAEVDPGPIAATARDSAIADATLRWALAEGLDTVPIGTAVVRIGRRFVGSPYTPGTLDPPGPEQLVVNLREFDCVTFVESVLALARAVRGPEPSFAAFVRELERLRYRAGARAGYASRLHYFSEWLHDNAGRGMIEIITPALGGVPDPERIRFMSDHPDAYRQLADADLRRRIRDIETALGDVPRFMLPEDGIAAAEDGILDGDVIAATSTLPGLDVAHTGIAVAIDGRIHLMHAPLVGDSVQISEVPLADRIRRIATQDGIMVARPL